MMLANTTEVFTIHMLAVATRLAFSQSQHEPKRKNAKMNTNLKALTLGLLGCTSTALIPAAQATISFVDLYHTNVFLQTSNGNTISYDGSYATMGFYSTNPNEFTSVSATYPGPDSPVTLPQDTPTHYGYGSTYFPTQAAMDAAFPTGTYAFTAQRSAGGPLATSLAYSGSAYPQTQPFLLGTDYTDLQGMNSAAPFAFHFSTFTPNPSTDSPYLFFVIFNQTSGAVVYDAGAQPPTTTGVTLPANTLNPGTGYFYDLIFSDRVTVPSPGADFPAQIGSDKRTEGFFTTAAPEPSGVALLASGALLLAGLRRGRQGARNKIESQARNRIA